MVDFVRDVLLAFARVHILFHASEQPIFGTGMMIELRRHGYALGPGTIYPLLHRLEADRLLVRRVKVEGGKARKYYALTRRGQAELDAIRPRLAELAEEVMPHSRIPAKHRRATRPRPP